MKSPLTKIAFHLLIAICICACKSKSTTHGDADSLTDTTQVDKEQDNGIPIDYDSTSVLKTVYVINENGVEAMQQPDILSEKVTHYEYGDKLEVIEVKSGWLGVRDRVTRKYKKDGSDWETTGWEKIYVQSNKIGELSALKLTPNDLNVVVNYSKNGQETISRLTNLISIELVSKADFDSKYLTAVDYLIKDTTVIIKKNGVIELPYRDNKIKKVC